MGPLYNGAVTPVTGVTLPTTGGQDYIVGPLYNGAVTPVTGVTLPTTGGQDYIVGPLYNPAHYIILPTIVGRII